MKIIIYLFIFLLIFQIVAAENITEKDIEITLNIELPFYINITYTNLFKLTNNNHISGQTDQIELIIAYNLTLNNNLILEDTFQKTINSHSSSNTGEITLTGYGNYSLCGEITNSSHPDNYTINNKVCLNFQIIPEELTCNISINISTEKIIYNNKETISFYNLINNQTFPFTIEYWIEDLFGNILKSKINTTNLNKKSYTPSIEETDKTIIIKNQLFITACNNLGKTSSQKVLTIKNNITINQSSSINLNSPPDESSFGDLIYIEVSAYRGNTLKRTIYSWIEDKDHTKVSEKAKTSLNQKYTSYEFNLPLQINPNCDDKLDSGKHYIIVEGIDITISEPIFLSGKNTKLCKTEYIKEETETKTETRPLSTRNSPPIYTLHNLPNKIYTNTSFNISINITNPNTISQNISIWAYLYIGSKSYSITREHNKISFILNPKESQILPLTITNLAEINKTYKLKVKINKNNQKTDYEITEELTLQSPPNTTQTSQNSSISTTKESQGVNLLPTGMLLLNTTHTTPTYQSEQNKLFPHTIYILTILILLAILLFYHFNKKN